MVEHGHSQDDVQARIGAPRGRGFLRDLVYGGIDGSITTFAIIAGVAGAGLDPWVIVALGFANVLADGFSMAAGNFSATKAELDDLARLREVERRHLRDYPEGERLEIREILRLKGLEGEVLEAATDAIAANEEASVQLMLEGEYGLASVDPHPWKAAVMTFVAFIAAGVIPLIPFVFGFEGAFLYSAIATAGVFFGIGALKSRWALVAWWWSGLETLGIGGVAAAIAYAVGTLFHLG
ncbi:VIT1/CCC1 transporter family protein [Pelagimonas sp. KU-00592-HH]|uniref:VIT1/CCC1 transporter family protein n=1 Tax=Pelagimonas sp. KU-00592-HH TaxID=3127651 RepID=UPI00310B7F70